MKKNWDNEILLCECHSDEHQILLFYNETEFDNGHKSNMCYAHVHLTTYKSFWKRLVHATKYIFGYKSKYGACLDDVRCPKTEGWDIVRTYDDFVNWVTKNGSPNEVSFDHDLAEINYDPTTQTESFVYYEKTGYDAAKWLCEYCWTNGLPLPSWNVHSANPVGRDNIIQLMKNFEEKLN